MERECPNRLIQAKIFHRSMSLPNKLSRPNLKRTKLSRRNRTRTARNQPGSSRINVVQLERPPRSLKRRWSESADPQSPETDAPELRRRRSNSAGPVFDATPYSLSMDYVDRTTGRNQDCFVEELSRYARQQPKFNLTGTEAKLIIFGNTFLQGSYGSGSKKSGPVRIP